MLTYISLIIHIRVRCCLLGIVSSTFVGAEQVDYDRRTLIAPNHTCTHMLNFALRVRLINRNLHSTNLEVFLVIFEI